MIYLQLFLAFFEIGAVSFGGGYAMISFISEKTAAYGWLTDDELINMIAISESTPGPIAVNMATFVGSSQGGFLGAVLATLGVVLPSFIIILIISSLLKRFLEYKIVNSFLRGVRPTVVGLILSTATIMFLSLFLSIEDIHSNVLFDAKSSILFLVIVILTILHKRLLKKNPAPIKLIIVSAALGVVIWGI